VLDCGTHTEGEGRRQIQVYLRAGETLCTVGTDIPSLGGVIADPGDLPGDSQT